MSVHTRSQKLAQAAFARVALHDTSDKDYVSFAKKFPALIHTCGLGQAVAFALAKNHTDYVEDLAAVLNAGGHPDVSSSESLHRQAREETLTGYLRLSRDAIHAASWLKRYVEAVAEEGE